MITTKKAIGALDRCIVKWEFVATGDFIKQCPIARYTSTRYCEGTPFLAFEDNANVVIDMAGNETNGRLAENDEAKHHARRMLSLLREVRGECETLAVRKRQDEL